MAKRVINEPLRAMAERMFVEEGMTAKSIAAALDITEQTVGRWRKGIQGDISWDDKKAQFLAAPHNTKKVLMNELNHLSKGGDATIDVKAIADVTKVISTLSEKVSAQIVFTVLREFDNWMATQDTDKAIEFLDWHRTFLLYKAQNEV